MEIINYKLRTDAEVNEGKTLVDNAWTTKSKLIKKSFSDRLLEINPADAKMFLLLIPTIQGIWLHAIGKKIFKVNQQNDFLFSFFALTTTITVTIGMLAPYFYAIFMGNIMEYVSNYFLISFLSVPFYIVTIGILSVLTVNYERKKESEKYFGPADSLDYIRRFFLFAFAPFFIWTFQKTVNEIYAD